MDAGRLKKAKTILDFVDQFYTLERTHGDAIDWVALKLSCSRQVAARKIRQAANILGPAWRHRGQLSGVADCSGLAFQLDPEPTAKPKKPIRPDQPRMPMTERAKQIVNQTLPLVDFLRWLDARGRLQHLTPWNPEDWVAEFKGIDMDVLTEERKAFLTYTQNMQNYWQAMETWRGGGGE